MESRDDKLRNKFIDFIETSDNISSSDLEERVIAKFGAPPYSFLREGDPVPVKSRLRKAKNVPSAKQQFETPGPNYRSFGKAQYVDSQGRHYKIASGQLKDKYIEDGTITYMDYENPVPFENNGYGTQLFWIQIPIATRHNVDIPQSFCQGEKLDLIHINTQIPCTGKILSKIKI